MLRVQECVDDDDDDDDEGSGRCEGTPAPGRRRRDGGTRRLFWFSSLRAVLSPTNTPSAVHEFPVNFRDVVLSFRRAR